MAKDLKLIYKCPCPGLDDDEKRSDVIALINYNPDENKMNILSIARDTRVKVNGKYMKINALIGKAEKKW